MPILFLVTKKDSWRLLLTRKSSEDICNIPPKPVWPTLRLDLSSLQSLLPFSLTYGEQEPKICVFCNSWRRSLDSTNFAPDWDLKTRNILHSTYFLYLPETYPAANEVDFCNTIPSLNRIYCVRENIVGISKDKVAHTVPDCHLYSSN
jgi:hypothetical protein